MYWFFGARSNDVHNMLQPRQNLQKLRFLEYLLAILQRTTKVHYLHTLLLLDTSRYPSFHLNHKYHEIKIQEKCFQLIQDLEKVRSLRSFFRKILLFS